MGPHPRSGHGNENIFILIYYFTKSMEICPVREVLELRVHTSQTGSGFSPIFFSKFYLQKLNNLINNKDSSGVDEKEENNALL